MNLGPAEVAVILLVALLVFGPARLPEISRQVGGAMRELRRMQSSLRSELDNAMRDDNGTAAASSSSRAPAPGSLSAGTAASTGEPDHTDFGPAAHPPAGAGDTAGEGDARDGFAGPGDSFL